MRRARYQRRLCLAKLQNSAIIAVFAFNPSQDRNRR